MQATADALRSCEYEPRRQTSVLGPQGRRTASIMGTTNAVAYGLRVAAIRLAVKAYAELSPYAGTDVADIA